jgi:hypothetical protein
VKNDEQRDGGGTMGKTFLISRPKPEGEVLSMREAAHMRR